MPATSFYAETEYDEQPHKSAFGVYGTSDNAGRPGDELINLDMENTQVDNSPKGGSRSTDLVRLYLQEIGRVRLLRRDEEVSEAQKVQRYMRLLDLRSEYATQAEEVVLRYVQLIDAHDRLASQLGHRPSLEPWAAAAGA